MKILDRLLNRSNGEAEVIPNATLVSHAGTTKVSRADLALIPEVVGTDTFQPIPHTRLVEQLEEALSFRHIEITREEFAVTPDGMKLFGLLELNSEHEGVRFAIGIRNANDKSMRLGMVAGYRVFVCDNMALSGDFKPLLAKHSKNFDLIEAVSMGVDRIQRNGNRFVKLLSSRGGTRSQTMTRALSSIVRSWKTSSRSNYSVLCIVNSSSLPAMKSSNNRRCGVSKMLSLPASKN
jgi:hypothetical protein